MKPWVKFSGTLRETDLPAWLAGQDVFEGHVCVAFYSDRFAGAAVPEAVMRLADDVEHLLEMRLFNESEELWIHRSCLGQDFSYRRASEEGLPVDGLVESFQTIDCAEVTGGPNERGCYEILSTSGGHFELPIQRDSQAVRVISYVDYDEHTQVATIADCRLAGFTSHVKRGAWK